MTAVDLPADVIVVGSGAAGLTAAILAHDHGARVAVLERSDLLGGTTAVSGGAAWIPLNHHMQEVGATDTRDEALAYCKRVTAGQAPDELVETFIDTSHEAIRYLEQHTAARFHVWSMPDYHPHFEGAKLGGRSIEPDLFDRNELGAWAAALRPAPLFLLPVTLQEATFRYQSTLKPWNLPANLLIERMEQGLIACGNALIGCLLKACLDRGITIATRTRARGLVMQEGRLAGLRADRDGEGVSISACAVVLASGGFEWNDQLRATYLPGPVDHPNSPPCNEGDGLIMAIEAGAALANMREVWGSPAAAIPGEQYDGMQLNRLVAAERACPHSILVNQAGRRFVNEGQSYNELGKRFDEVDADTGRRCNLPCWTIFDRQYRERYPLLTVMPGHPDPEWLLRDDSLEGLARTAGIDAPGLAATINRWNSLVREGADPDFGRQRSPMDFEAPHPSMGTIEQPPFYALSVYQGTLGTKGGPVTNKHGQVLSSSGGVIPGLYAAGNVMASVAGAGYYGGGATIGLAMTWGYLCGIHAARAAKH